MRSVRYAAVPSPRPETAAAVLFAICAAFIAGIWIIFLFVSNPKGVTALDNLSYALSSSQNEHAVYFRWLAAFVIASAALSVAYFSAWPRSKYVALFLLWVSISQSIAAIIVLPLKGAVLFIVPLAWCYLCWQRA